MTFDLNISVAMLALVPFLAAALAPLLQRLLRSYAGWVLALLPAGMFAFLVSLAEPVSQGLMISPRFAWVRSFGLDFSLRLDGLSLVFALAITGIGALILVYAAAYLKGHAHQGRFMAFLLAFMGAMLGLVLADNLIALFSFWELTSVTSFLLIGFDHRREASRRAAIQALVVTGIGGLGLLLGAVLLHHVSASWEISGLDEAVTVSSLYPAILLLVLLAAFTKSAQLPFHFWLPNAMEAPTPVSAFLHSATMVQGGVYLLLRLSPALGGTALWTILLTVFGGATLLWGSVVALRQTDLKYMLAHSTIASLGLLVLLIGIGSELAITAAILYFVAHALYKAGLFLVVGVIDHETGTRDLTTLGGLSDKLPASFIAAALAAFSMIGLPASLGFLAKEEMYRGLASGAAWDVVLVVVLVLGNAVLAGLACIVAVRPFLGPDKPTPKVPHEASVGLLAGPLALGAAGIAAGVLTGLFGPFVMAPAVSAVLGQGVESHLSLMVDPLSPALWLSLVTWALAVLVFLRLEAMRTMLRRAQEAFGWSFDRGFDQAMFGLIRLAGAVTRFLHHGRLEIYLVALFAMLAVTLLLPIALLGGWPGLPPLPELAFYEWSVVGLALLGLATLLLARSRLIAILALGIQGLALALLFLLFGAPDLAFTQLMVEILSVVILTLVMTRLRLDIGDHRRFADLARDGGLALLCGLGLMLLLWRVLDGVLDPKLAEFFAAASGPLAHGRNIVNVILVDFRGLDTLGEISVVMAAGIGVLALLRSRPKKPEPAPILPAVQPKRPRRPRKSVAKPAVEVGP